MTIPSSLLIQEIMHYEGFAPKPVQSRIGMPCIGYGFPLWEEALDIVHGNTKLAKHIKNNLPKNLENTATSVQRLLQLPFAVTEETAKKLLIQSLLYHAKKLSQQYAGFRHLVNQCGTAVIYPYSSLAAYEKQLITLNEEAKKSKTKQGTQSKMPSFVSAQNSTEQPLHPAFLQSFYASSAAFAGANPFRQHNFFANHRKVRRRKNVPIYPDLSTEEQALLRVDSVLFASHLLGIEIMLHMHDFFLALQEDNYLEASNQLLSHRASSYLGAIMAILARRIREASLDYRDIARQKADIPTMHLHRKKAKNYFLQYAAHRSNCGNNEQRGQYEQGKMTGAFYGA